MRKIITILTIFVFISVNIGYALQDVAYNKTNLRVPLSTKEREFVERNGNAWDAFKLKPERDLLLSSGPKLFRRSIIITTVGTFVTVMAASLGLLDLKISYPRVSRDSLSRIEKFVSSGESYAISDSTFSIQKSLN